MATTLSGILPFPGRITAGDISIGGGYPPLNFCYDIGNHGACPDGTRSYYITTNAGQCNGDIPGGGNCGNPLGCNMCLNIEVGSTSILGCPALGLTSNYGSSSMSWADNTQYNGGNDTGNPATLRISCDYPVDNNQPIGATAVNAWTAAAFDWTDPRTQAATNYLLGGPDGQPQIGYCFQTVTTCPIDPLTAKPMPSCSRAVSTAGDAGPCQAWLTQAGIFKSFDPTAIDAKITSYCQRNPNNGDCGCVNRQNNPLFQIAKGALGNNIPDHCFYLPCTTQGSTTELSRSIDQQGSCPTKQEICTNIQQFINEQGASYNQEQIQQIQQITNCFNGPNPGPSPNPTPNPSPNPSPNPTPTPNPTPNPTEKHWYQKWWGILLIILGSLLILGLLIGLIVYLAKKK